MRKREENTINKVWSKVEFLRADADEATIKEAMSAKEKAYTLCKKYGKCDMFGQFSKNNVACKNCENDVMQKVCMFKMNEEFEAAKKEQEAKAEKSKKSSSTRIPNNDMKNAMVFIVENPLLSRKAVIDAMAKDSARSVGGWKTMIGALFLAKKNLEGAGSGKGAYHWASKGIESGIGSFKELKAYVAKMENKTENAVGRSVQYVWTTWNVMKEMNAE